MCAHLPLSAWPPITLLSVLREGSSTWSLYVNDMLALSVPLSLQPFLCFPRPSIPPTTPQPTIKQHFILVSSKRNLNSLLSFSNIERQAKKRRTRTQNFSNLLKTWNRNKNKKATHKIISNTNLRDGRNRVAKRSSRKMPFAVRWD